MTRGDFTRSEIRAANEEADASARAQDDFRRHEIREMNAAGPEVDGATLMKWGAVGLLLAVFVMMATKPSRSRK